MKATEKEMNQAMERLLEKLEKNLAVFKRLADR